MKKNRNQLNSLQAKDKILALIMALEGVGRLEAEALLMKARIPEKDWNAIAAGNKEIASQYPILKL